MEDATALSWIERALNVSLLLVAIGVAGELVGNLVAGPIRKRLDTAKDLEIAQLHRETEELRRQNLQLQRSIVHRMIPQTGEGEKRNWDSLKPFKGVNVLFQYSPQREPEGFAGNLATFPMNAGWNLLGINAAARDEIPDGVLVEAYLGPNGETDLSTEAAKSLVAFLESNGIEGTRRSPGKKGTLAANTVVVRIGQLPDPSKALD